MSAFILHPLPLPQITTPKRSITHLTPHSSLPSFPSISRRTALLLPLLLLPLRANALSIGDRSIQKDLTKVKLTLSKIRSLEATLSALPDTIPPEDILYVQRFIALWIEAAHQAITHVSQSDVQVPQRKTVAEYGEKMRKELEGLKMQVREGRKGGVVDGLRAIVETGEAVLAMEGLKRFLP